MKTDKRSRLFRVVVLCADSNHPGESDEALEVKRSRRSQVEGSRLRCEEKWVVRSGALLLRNAKMVKEKGFTVGQT